MRSSQRQLWQSPEGKEPASRSCHKRHQVTNHSLLARTLDDTVHEFTTLATLINPSYKVINPSYKVWTPQQIADDRGIQKLVAETEKLPHIVTTWTCNSTKATNFQLLFQHAKKLREIDEAHTLLSLFGAAFAPRAAAGLRARPFISGSVCIQARQCTQKREQIVDK